MNQIDLAIFRWLNSLVGRSEWLDTFIVFFAEWLIWWMAGALVLFLVFGKDKRRELKIIFEALATAVSARFVVAEVIRYFYDRARPFEVLGIYRLMDHSAGSAFPSGHASFSFALAMAIYFYYPKTSALFFLAAILISLGRVAVGVHWPSDVLGGAIVGVLTVWALDFLFKKFKINN